MSDLLLIIDEWIWADLAGENSYEKQQEAFRFLVKVLERCDRLAVVRGSPFLKKFFTLCKNHDVMVRKVIKLFIDSFLRNSDKSVNYEETELQALREEIAKEVKKDDHYLVRAYLSAGVKALIITTDNPLRESLVKHNINCQHRNEFLPKYIRGNETAQEER